MGDAAYPSAFEARRDRANAQYAIASHAEVVTSSAMSSERSNAIASRPTQVRGAAQEVQPGYALSRICGCQFARSWIITTPANAIHPRSSALLVNLMWITLREPKRRAKRYLRFLLTNRLELFRLADKAKWGDPSGGNTRKQIEATQRRFRRSFRERGLKDGELKLLWMSWTRFKTRAGHFAERKFGGRMSDLVDAQRVSADIPIVYKHLSYSVHGEPQSLEEVVDRVGAAFVARVTAGRGEWSMLLAASVLNDIAEEAAQRLGVECDRDFDRLAPRFKAVGANLGRLGGSP
jgi:hypothetical protein